MFYRSLCGAILGTIFVASPLHASEMIEIAPFREAGYTNGFTQALDMNIEMEMREGAQVTKTTMTVQIFPGKPIRKFEGDWIGVPGTGRLMVEQEKVEVRFLSLYDPTTLQQRHSIDLSDESMSTYQWENVPRSMRVGQKLKAGVVTEKDSSGRTLSIGDVEFILSKFSDGFEFCTVETVINLESKEQEIVKDCDRFDSKKKIVGNSIEIKLGSQLITTGTGKIRVK